MPILVAPKRKELQDEEDRLRELRKFNPLYKLDKQEALLYASKMGASDTARGIAQLFGKGGEYFGVDGLTDYLKEKDKKLNAIFNSSEYGNEALATFLGSAVVFDPVSYVPIIGWMSKGKKAKNLWDLTKYGGSTGAIVAGLGYTPEDYGQLISDADASLVQKRLENAAIGGTFASALTAGGGKVVDKYLKFKGKKGLFEESDEVYALKSSNDKLSKEEEKIASKDPLQVGQIVRARDRNNIGTIIDLDDDTGVATVKFVNKRNGTTATKRFSQKDLRPNRVTKAKPLKDKKDSQVERPDDVVFVIDDTSNPSTLLYRTKDRITGKLYTIRKAFDENDKVIKGQWELIVTKEQKYKPKGSKRRKTRTIQERPIIFGSLTKAKEYVKRTIKPQEDFDTKTLINKEIQKESRPKKSINRNAGPILSFWQDNFGYPILNVARNNIGETVGGVSGFMYGATASEDDPNTWYPEKFSKGLQYAAIGAGGVKGFKALDKKFYDGQGAEMFARAIIPDYNLPEEYITLKRKTQIERNTIISKFLDITKRAKDELTPEQDQLLWQFMSGEMFDLTKLTKEARQLDSEGRKLVTKYAQEMVDLGLLDEKIFKKHINTYLKRSYLKNLKLSNPFTRTSKEDITSPVTKKDRKKPYGELTLESVRQLRLLGDELKPRGLTLKTTKKEYNSNPKYKQEGWEIIKQGKGKNATITIRKDFTKEQRQAMGEIESAAYAFRETGRYLANDVSVSKFFNSLATNPKYKKFIIDKATFDSLDKTELDKWVRISDDNIKGTNRPRFGNLGGKYTTPEIARDLNATFNFATKSDNILKPVARAFDAIQRTWKTFKTAYTPSTHTGNFNSNIILMDFADVEYSYLPKAMKVIREGDKNPLFREAQINGIFDVNLINKELNNVGSDIERSLIKALDDPNQEAGLLGYSSDLLKNLKKVPDKAEDLYVLEDSVFRLATYMDRIEKGFSVEEASLEARKWFIDYDINAPLVNALKRSFVPFISYSYRVAPLLFEAAVLRPHKFAKWAAIIGATDLAGQAIARESSKLERLTMKESDKKRLYNLDLLPYTTIKTPFKNEKGNSFYLDIGRMIPGGDIFEQRQEGSVKIPGVPMPLQPGGLWFDFAFMLTTGKDPFTGVSVVGPEGEVVGPTLKTTFKKSLPNIAVFFPGSYNDERLKKAIRANRRGLQGQRTTGSIYAAEPGIIEALLYNLGIRLRPQDVQANKQLKETIFKQEEAELKGKISGLRKAYQRENISYEDYKKEEAEQTLLLLRLYGEKELYDNAVAAEEIKRSKRLYERKQKFKGGQISEDYPVPNVKKEPSEMINKATGQPYEAEMERLGMEDGGLLVSIGVAPVSEKQIGKLKKGLKKRKAMREGGESVIEEIEVLGRRKGRFILDEDIVEGPFMSYYNKPVRLKETTMKDLIKAQEQIPDIPINIVDNTVRKDVKVKAYEKWVAGGKKGPPQAGAKSYHVTGQAFDLNQEDPKMRNPKVWQALEKNNFKQHPKEWWHWSQGEFTN